MNWASRIVLGQAALLVIFSSWALGGRASWAPLWMAIIAWSSLIPLVLFFIKEWRWQRGEAAFYAAREGVKQQSTVITFFKKLFILLPWILAAIFMLISILNAGYEPKILPNGNKVYRRIDNIDYLPATVNAERTVEKVALLTGVMALSIALFYLVRRRRDIRSLLQVIFINSLVLSIIGTLFNLLKADRILGLFDPVNPQFFSSFRYHNHWAGFALLCLGVGLALYGYYRKNKDVMKSRSRPATFFLGMLFFLALSIALAGARAGMLLLLIMGGLFFLWLWRTAIHKRRRERQRKPFLLKYIIFATITLGVSWLIYQLGEEMIQSRWQKSLHQYENILMGEKGELRIYATRDTPKMALARPWWGWGLGSFVYVFRYFAGPEFYQGHRYIRFEFAHQDWLQYWAELGSVGFFFFLATPVMIVIHAWRKGKTNPVSGWLAVGCGLILLMACIEFPLSNPAIIALFFILGSLAAKYALLEAASQRKKI